MYITLLLLVPSACFLIYRAYNYFLGPYYRPGAVAAAAEKDPDKFDPPSLRDQSTSSSWAMPDGINLYHMQTPSEPSATTTSPALCISGGPGVAVSEPWSLCSSPALITHLTFHTYHARGCGRSTHPFSSFPGTNLSALGKLESKLGLSEQVADIERIRRRLNTERIVLLGHSFGGLVATLYAAEFPEHVAALALFTPASMLSTPGKDFDLFAEIRSRLAENERTEWDAFVRRYLDFGALVNMTDEQAGERQVEFMNWFLRASGMPESSLNGMCEIGGWTTYATYCSLGLKYDLRPSLTQRLKKARFRTVIVNGARDIVPVSEGQTYRDLFPREHVECKVVDAAHDLVQNHDTQIVHQVVHAVRETLLSTW